MVSVHVICSHLTQSDMNNHAASDRSVHSTYQSASDDIHLSIGIYSPTDKVGAFVGECRWFESLHQPVNIPTWKPSAGRGALSEYDKRRLFINEGSKSMLGQVRDPFSGFFQSGLVHELFGSRHFGQPPTCPQRAHKLTGFQPGQASQSWSQIRSWSKSRLCLSPGGRDNLLSFSDRGIACRSVVQVIYSLPIAACSQRSKDAMRSTITSEMVMRCMRRPNPQRIS